MSESHAGPVTPPIPGHCAPGPSKQWAAWQFLWDELGPGEWRRSCDLTNAYQAARIGDIAHNNLARLLHYGSLLGLLEKEVRIVPKTLTSYRRTESWYRRPS